MGITLQTDHETRIKQCTLPYSRQHIFQEDIQAVIEILRSDWLTQGPAIEAFERKLAEYLGAACAVACSSGTAALHLAMLALRIGPDDAIVTSPNAFLADANCARYVGADVKFADIDPETGLMDPESLSEVFLNDRENKIKAVIPVHFAGQSCDLPKICEIAKSHGAWVIDDACHALGATFNFQNRVYRPGDSIYSDMTVFSFHPVKHVAMGEGGAITTGNPEFAWRLRRLRSHGMRKDNFAEKEMALSSDGETNPWYYEMKELGFNYRVTDLQAALGLSQMNHLAWSLNERNRIARTYGKLISETFLPDTVRSLQLREDVSHAYHLFVMQIDFDHFGVTRASVMNRLRKAGIGTQVHYIPIHLQPYYRSLYDCGEGDFPNSELYYSRALSLPMYPDLTDDDCRRVISELNKALTGEN